MYLLDFITLIYVYTSHTPYINMWTPCAIIAPGAELIPSPFPAFVSLTGSTGSVRALHRRGPHSVFLKLGNPLSVFSRTGQVTG